MRVLSLTLLASLSFVANAQLALSPPTIVPKRSDSIPVVTAASSGDTFFLGWEERFVGTYPSTSTSRYRTFDAAGKPLESLPRRLPGRNSPSAVWNGTEFFVAWASYLSQFDTSERPMLEGMRFSSTGEPVEGSHVTLANGRSTVSAKVVWSGREYLASGARTVIAAPDGQPLRTLDTTYWPLASTSGTFLVSLFDPVSFASYAVILDESGVKTADVNVERRRTSLEGASHGDEYAMVSADDSGVTAVTLSTRGEVKERYSFDSPGKSSSASVTWSGDSYLAAWSTWNDQYRREDDHLCFARFGGSVAATTQCIARGGLRSSIALASGNRKTLVAWSERAANGALVFSAFVDPRGIPDIANATVASVGMQAQRYGSIESDGNGYTVAWNEPGDTPRAMIGGVERSFSVRTARILAAPVSSPTRLARGEDATLAVWATEGEHPQVFAQRLAAGHELSAPVLIGEGTSPAVAFDGISWLIVWRSPADDPQLLATIVTSGGIVAVPGGLPLSPSDGRQLLPAVASRGGDFLVAWIEASPTLRPQLRAVGVGTSGQVTGGTMTLADSSDFIALDIAASGRQYLIVVRDAGNISLPVTSVVPDILVGGFANYGPLRVHPRPGGGFAVLADRMIFIDSDGNAEDGGAVPGAEDFTYDASRLIFVERHDDRLFVAVYGGRVRSARRGVQ